MSSPIARALIGKSEGDTVEVKAPAGVREYEVLAVRYSSTPGRQSGTPAVGPVRARSAGNPLLR